jgi:hypothetical protein
MSVGDHHSKDTPPSPKPGNVPPPGSVPKLPQTIFNLEKKGESGSIGGTSRPPRR